MDQKVLIPGAIILAGVIVAGALLYSKLPSSPASLPAPAAGASELLKIRKDDFILGNPAAKVVLVEYGDFQCPFCGRFFKTTEQQLTDAYIKTGKAALVWRDFPFLGQESFRAAEAARCAAEQGKFWEYHDYLFNHQNGENEGAFADQNLKNFAGALGLDQNKFNSCFDSGKYAQAVSSSADDGKNAGVTGTPTTFVDGQMVSGAQPFSAFQQIIETELKK